MSNGGSNRRRTARDDVLKLAAARLGRARLPDLLEFLHPTALAKEVGRAKGTGAYHFAKGGLAQPLARYVLDPTRTPVIDQLIIELDEAARVLRERANTDAVALVRRAAERDIITYSRTNKPQYVMLYAATAASPGDRAASAAGRRFYAVVNERLAASFESLLRAWKREPRTGLDHRALATVVQALADGYVMRGRFDRPAVPPDLFGTAVLALALGLTRPTSAATDEPLEVLLATDPSALSAVHEQQVRIAKTAYHLYTKGGWDAVTAEAVAGGAKIDQSMVHANFGDDRRGLAAAVWRHLYLDLEKGIDRDSGLDFDERLKSHLRRLAGMIANERPVTVAFLELVFSLSRLGPPKYQDPNDARTFVPLPKLLQRIIHDGREVLRPDLVKDEDAEHEFAAFLTHVVLQRSLLRPHDAASDIVEYVTSSVLGATRRPKRRTRT